MSYPKARSKVSYTVLEQMKLRDEFLHCSSELWILKQRVADLEERCRELAKKFQKEK